jgi:Retrotransposon gag protein/Zinc knuckle
MATPAALAPNPKVWESLIKLFDKGLNRTPPGGGGGGGGSGGGRGGGGGGGGGGEPALPPAALQPIVPAQDVRAMANKPENFWGDRTKAEEFIEEVKGYLWLNADVVGYNSPKTKAAFTLTCMKGSEVAGWVKNMGEIIEDLDPADNVPLFWDYFLQEFDRQYLDSTREDRAWLALQSLKLKDNDIDAYIAKFEELACQADYTVGGTESIQLFKNGLSRPVLADIMWAPPVVGYNVIKEWAIHSTTAQRTLDNWFSGTRNKPAVQTTNRPFFFSNWSSPHPLYQPCPTYQNSGGRQPSYQSQYNSSNAPSTYNNRPVPMDIGRSRTWQGRGRGTPWGQWRGWANVANAPSVNDKSCFQCGEIGHFIRNCPNRQEAQANTSLIDFDPYKDTLYEESQTKGSRISNVKASMDMMTFDKKQQLAQELKEGSNEDFPWAWLGRHWSGKTTIKMCTCQLGNQWQYNAIFIQSWEEPKS